jgi:hypothetical protein
MRTPQTSTLTKLPSAGAVSEQQIEAAQYAVLRRLAPCLRHHMVRPLQPIGLIYGVMHHKLSAVQPDLPSIREEADKINGFAKAALDECLEMSTWLAPEPGTSIRLDAGVGQCVGLLATMLHFCGFQLDNEVQDVSVQVPRHAVRTVVSAALLALTDSLEEPATLTISADIGDGGVSVTLQITPVEGDVDRYEDGYRKLVWADVQALAAAQDVGLSHEDDRIVMHFAAVPAQAQQD